MRHTSPAALLALALSLTALQSCGDPSVEPAKSAEIASPADSATNESAEALPATPVVTELANREEQMVPVNSAATGDPEDSTVVAQAPSKSFTPLVPIHVETAETRWYATDQQAARRVALVIGTDKAKLEKVALKAAKPAVKELARVLNKLRFDEVIALTGDQVKSDLIQAKIAEITADMSAPGNQLLVAWIGHGYVSNSVQELATAESTWLDGIDGAPGRLGSPLAYDELLGWVHDSQARVRAAGGELSTAMWIDACRTGTQSIGDNSLTVNEKLADLQVFSAGRGKEAFVNTDLSMPYFTAEVCKQLEHAFQPPGGQAGRSLVDLKACMERAKENSQSVREQEPAWVGRNGLERFLLYDPNYLSLTVRVVDALSGAPIEESTLTFQGEKKAGALATFGGRIPSEEGYQLRAHAPGYFGRSQVVWLEQVETAMRDHQVLDVPLTPAFMAVEGSVDVTGQNSDLLRVFLEGLDEPLAPISLTGGGRYRLVAPISADVCDLVVYAGKKELFREPLSLKALTAPRRVDDYDVPVYVRDPLRLDRDSTTQVGAGETESKIGDTTVKFNWDSLQATDFYTGGRTYGDIRSYTDKEDYENALGILERLGDKQNGG